VTADPAFGALIAVPLVLLALGCAYAVRVRGRGLIAVLAGLAVGLAAGCGASVLSGPARPQPSAAPAADAGPGEAAASPASAAPAAAGAAPGQAAALQPRDRQAALAAARDSGTISIDVVDDRSDGRRAEPALTLAADATLHVIGWAFVEGKNAPCRAVALVVDGRAAFPARYGYARADVATHFGTQAVLYAGYAAAVPAAKLGRGPHAARIVCIGEEQAAAAAKRLSITVR
jgi:hypothetical protein